MGFLEAGKPMEWQDDEEYHKIIEYVKKHGVIQFIKTWNNVKDRVNDGLMWGDEIEFHLFTRIRDPKTNKIIGYKLINRAAELLAKLEHEDSLLPKEKRRTTWHPEYGAWMVEATPSAPYGGLTDELLRVEPNMRIRRHRVTKALNPDEGVITTVAWPLLGVKEFVLPWQPTNGSVANSDYIPDSCINPHPRFATLTRNIRKRRGKKVNIHVPMFHDVNTKPEPSHTVTNASNDGTMQTKEIYMDAMGFGMGCCCLQVTFQARDLDESRHLYDQLSVLCPIFLALTAGTPILKGYLADTDIRWSTISQSVDCRTPVENGSSATPIILPNAKQPQRGVQKIQKSRYDSVSLYISQRPLLLDSYNDIDAEIDQDSYKTLIENGVDERLARHVSHLFIRDPLVIFSDRIEVNDDQSTEHFENIQSTNWQTMRWKPPPPNTPGMGWRVEFRPMEVQFTDFENAAFTVIIALIARCILFFDLNLYIPMSKVQENMKRAHTRDAVLKEKFFFRKNLIPLESSCLPERKSSSSNTARFDKEEEYQEMSVHEILLGVGADFPGLVPLIWSYLDIVGVTGEARAKVNEYIDLVVQRCTGELPTPARWMRNFVHSHPDYKQDSVVSEVIAGDLIEAISSIADGSRKEVSFLKEHHIVPLEDHSFDHDQNLLSKPQDFGHRLRGASFQEELGITNQHAYQCAIVASLVQKYTSALARSEHLVSDNQKFSHAQSFLDSKTSRKRTKA